MASQKVYKVGDLFQSATYGDLVALTTAVSHGVPIDSVTVGGSSVLHFAAYGGHARMVSHLLTKYPESIAKGHDLDMQGYNALHNCCAFSGSIGVFEQLLRAGFDIMAKTSDGLTSLELAEQFEKNELVQHIRDSESDNSIGDTHLLPGRPGIAPEDDCLSETEQRYDSEMTIPPHEINDADSREERRYTIVDLLSSAERGDVELLDKVVDSGIAVNQTTKGGSSVLHFAASNGQTEMIHHLINKYPDCRAKGQCFDPKGYTALHHVARLGKVDVFEALVRVGFDKKVNTADGWSVLDLAREAKQIDLINHLLAQDQSDFSYIRVKPTSMPDSGLGSASYRSNSDSSYIRVKPTSMPDSGLGSASYRSNSDSSYIRVKPTSMPDSGLGSASYRSNSDSSYIRVKPTSMPDSGLGSASYRSNSDSSYIRVTPTSMPDSGLGSASYRSNSDSSYIRVTSPSMTDSGLGSASYRSGLSSTSDRSDSDSSYIRVISPSMPDSGLGSTSDRSGLSSTADHYILPCSMTSPDTDHAITHDVQDNIQRADTYDAALADTPEESHRKWIALHRCAEAGNSLEVMSMIENGADSMKKISSVFFPNIHLEHKQMLTPMEVALYARQNEMMGLLTRYTDEEIVRKCLLRCEGAYASSKPYIVKEILRKKYKDKHIDIVFGEFHPKKLKMFVIYTNTIAHGSETSEADYPVLFRNPTVSSDEGRKVLHYSHEKNCILSEDDRKLVAQAIKQESDKLWNGHSNLRGIMSSPVKSAGGSFTEQACLVLLCHFKGFVPDNEPMYPREIQVGDATLPVDVREGHVVLHHVECPDALHTRLSFGCNIGAADDVTTRFGTVGPFVQLENGKIGFITCAHVVHGSCNDVCDSLPDISVLQPSNGAATMLPEEARLCGKVVGMKYSLDEDTSIDIAVVEITVPERAPLSPGFAAYSQEQLSRLGISENRPVFDHGESGEPTVGREIIKFGSASGVTYGTYRGIETSEFRSTLQHGRASQTERWRGVYYIENRQCIENDCHLPAFSAPGDSGAGVFQLVRGNNSKSQVRDDNSESQIRGDKYESQVRDDNSKSQVRGDNSESQFRGDNSESRVRDDKSESLICVGILVGADTATGSGIVIPIKPILDTFGLKLKVFQSPVSQRS